MTVSDTQIYDLINKTNIIYNVVLNQLDIKVSAVNANVINSQNAVQNRITLAANQERSDVNLIYNNLTTSINNVHNTVYNDIVNSTNKISDAIQKKIDASNAIIQQKIDSSNQLVQQKLDSVNGELKTKVTEILSPVLSEITKQTTNITNNINNAIDTLKVDTKSANIITQNLIKNTSDNLNSAIKNLSTITANLNNNTTPIVPNLEGILGSTEPAWLTRIMEQIYSGNANNANYNNGGFLSNLFSAVSANPSNNIVDAITGADVIGELGKQLHAIGQIETDLLSGKYKTLDDFNNALKSAGIESTILGGVVQLFFIIANIGDIVKAFGEPAKVKIEQFVTAAYSLKQLSESDILQAFIRNQIDYNSAIKELDNLGHSKSDSELILKNSYPKFNVQELLKLAHLGKIDPKTLQTRLRELGWSEFDAILQGYVNQPRPGINDLIQFAVKEVYSPETYKKFGQYEEFPKEFADRAKLEGLDETFAQQYWAAHWDLPSAQMGYQLLHRGIISTDDLKALLKALDVMPFWRDKLIQLSYNVVGRIDTRRLYAYGIWDKQRVYQEYLHEGYSPKDAGDLTKFTIMYDDEQDSKHKTKLQAQAHNVYIKAYNNRLIDKNTAKDKLLALGYKSQDIDLELSLEDYESYVDKHKLKVFDHTAKIISISLDGYRKRALSKADLLDTLTKNGYSLADANKEADLTDLESKIVFKESVVKEIQKLYFESLYDDNAVLTKLMSLGFANSESLNIIAELQILKNLDDKKPTQMQFEKMYKAGILSREDYANILAESGYNSKYIDKLIQLAEAG
jgi:hypothetical protein